MGQYFKAVNLDKCEFVCPWCINGGAEFLEWCGNDYGRIWNLLLRQSSETGGGDIGTQPLVVNLDSFDAENFEKQIQDALKYAMSCEGERIRLPEDSMVGRWAGDRVTLVGDYDASDIWKSLPSFRNISRELVDEWNKQMPKDISRLEFNANCTCNE
jgi:hypothetical protein